MFDPWRITFLSGFVKARHDLVFAASVRGYLVQWLQAFHWDGIHFKKPNRYHERFLQLSVSLRKKETQRGGKRQREEGRERCCADEFAGIYTCTAVSFAAAFAAEQGARIGDQGAEREVRVPDELERFRDLPMRVVFQSRTAGDAEKNRGSGAGAGGGTVGTDPPAVDTKVLRLVSVDDGSGMTEWGLADVRLNRQGPKGSRLNKKQAALRYRLAPSDIRQVNLYIEL